MASPAGVQLTPTEQKDLDKFLKYLSMKAVQVVVQSRLGDPLKAPSNPDITGGTTWFNLGVKDSPEVQGETKRSLSGSIPSPGLPLVCEISLKTAEGDSLVLEVWRLAVVAGGDPAVKVTHQVYNRMSLLLKSLVTVARVTPAYKLSRRQGPDSYVICYRVMLGDPGTAPDLGEGALTARVGMVTTPVSTIVCCVDYRTNMTITQRHAAASQPILVKSDHFDARHGGQGGHSLPETGHHPPYHGRGSGPWRHSDCESSDAGDRGGVTSDESQDAMRIFATSPLDRDVVYGHRPRTDSNSSVSSQDRFKIGAFAGGGDSKPDNLPSLEEELAGEPLLQLLPRARPSSAISVTSGETVSNTSVTDTETQFQMSSDSGSRVQLTEASKQATTAKIIPESQGARPKPRRSLSDFNDGGVSSSSSVPTSGGHEALMRKASGGSLFGAAEIAQDFVMIDLKTPFAQSDTSTSATPGFSAADPSLGSFFKDVSAAPRLSVATAGAGEDAGASLETWSSQLDKFESRAAEYDDLLNMMGSGSEAETDP